MSGAEFSTAPGCKSHRRKSSTVEVEKSQLLPSLKEIADGCNAYKSLPDRIVDAGGRAAHVCVLADDVAEPLLGDPQGALGALEVAPRQSAF